MGQQVNGDGWAIGDPPKQCPHCKGNLNYFSGFDPLTLDVTDIVRRREELKLSTIALCTNSECQRWYEVLNLAELPMFRPRQPAGFSIGFKPQGDDDDERTAANAAGEP